MTSYLPVIFDVTLVLVLLFFFLRGRKKGLVLTLCGLVAVFVALFGARFLATHLSPLVADALEPRFMPHVEQYVDENLDKQLDLLLNEEDPSFLTNTLKALGLYDGFADRVRELLGESTAQAVTGTAASLARAIAETVASVLIFILGFILIYVLWLALSRLLNLAARLPLIHGLNGLLGGLFGLGEGVLLLFLAAWVLKLAGGVIPEDIVSQSTVLNFFMTHDPLSIFTGI